MYRVFVLPVLSIVSLCLLAACSHTPRSTIPVTEKAAQPPVATAPRPDAPVATLPGTAPVSPAPALSYRPPAAAAAPRLQADGTQLPAVQGLLASADKALRNKDMELAAANLERAQRLAPQSATVYQRLADVRLRQKRAAEAEQLARKALAFASQPAQQAQLWRQIAAARQQLGQSAAAMEAQQKAASLEAAARAEP